MTDVVIDRAAVFAAAHASTAHLAANLALNARASAKIMRLALRLAGVKDKITIGQVARAMAAGADAFATYESFANAE
jgi:hypothetical protein